MSSKPKLLFVSIPAIPIGAAYTHHPISISVNPQRHRLYELTDPGEARTEWLEFFERIFVGLYLKTRDRVPYIFRTTDGSVRSLDAGCLKMLKNRSPKEVIFSLSPDGYIECVEPTEVLLQRYEHQKEDLISLVSV